MRVLVIRTDFLGDGVLSSPFIYALQHYAVSIDLLCYDYNYAAFKFNPHLSDIYCLKKNEPLSSKDNQAIIKNIYSKDYIAVFILNRDRENYQFVFDMDTRYVFSHELGYKSFNSRCFMYYAKLKPKYYFIKYDDSIHEVINSFNLLKFGLKTLRANSYIDITTPNCFFYTDTYNPDDPLNKTQVDKNKVALNISGRADTVRYIPTSLAICIINGILAQNKSILLIASANDKDRALEILNAIPNSTNISLCCESDVFVVANQMSQSEYFIGADGGLLHVAAGLGMKCIGLFHAQNINSWHPWTTTQVCLQTATKRIYDISPMEVIAKLDYLANDILSTGTN